MFDDSKPIHTYKGQVYFFDDTEPYTRVDGTQTRLHVWISHCAHCGGQFELRTPATCSTFSPNRRCQKHKRPGCRVRGERGLA